MPRLRPLRQELFIRTLRLWCMVLGLSSWLSLLAAAPESLPRRSFSIAAATAEESLIQFSLQSGLEVVFTTQAVANVTTRAVKGQMAAMEALDHMLAGTELSATRDPRTNVITIKRQKTMNKPATTTTKRALTAALAMLAVQDSSNAQTSGNPAPPEEENVNLSPFHVSSTRDVGYISTNTLAGTRFDQALVDVPQSISIINRQLLEDLSQNNPIEAMEYGVSGAARRSFLNTDFEIRGFRVTEEMRDGIPMRVFYNQPLYNVERIEVIKGPAALLYGRASNPGGMVNYVSIRPTRKPQGSVSASIGIPDGNYNYQTARLNVSGPLAANGDLRYRVTTGYLDTHGQRAFTFDKDRMYSAALDWDIGSSSVLRTEYTWVRKTYNVDNTFYLRANDPVAPSQIFDVGGEFGNTAPWSFRRQETNRVMLSLESVLSPLLKLRFAGQFYRNMYVAQTGGVGLPSTLGNRMTSGANRTDLTPYKDVRGDFQFDALSEQQFGKFAHNRLSLGAAFNESWVGAAEDVFTMPTGTTNAVNLDNPVYSYPNVTTPGLTRDTETNSYIAEAFVQDQVELLRGRVIVVGGTRWNYLKEDSINRLTNVATYTPGKDVWVSRIGAVAKPTKWSSIYYNYSESWAFVSGFDVLGRANQPRYGILNEFGVKADYEAGENLRLTAAIAFFDNSQTNVNIPYVDPVNNISGQIQAGKQITKGYEADVTMNYSLPRGNLSLIGTLYDADPRDEFGLPFVYAITKKYSLWTRYQVTQGRLKNLTAAAGYYDTADRRSLVIANYPVLPAWPGFSRVDLMFGYRWNRYSFQLNVGNLLNRHYFSTAPHAQYLTDGMPRNYKFTVNFAW